MFFVEDFDKKRNELFKVPLDLKLVIYGSNVLKRGEDSLEVFQKTQIIGHQGKRSFYF